MAVLISPSNNTGWGLGVRSMFGGARVRSNEHPVLVRQHYRAAWGSRNNRRRRAVAPAVAAVRAAARAGRRRHRRRGRVIPSILAGPLFARRRRGRRPRALPAPVRGPRIRHTRRLANAIEAVLARAAGAQPRRSARISSRRARGLVPTYHPSIAITRGYRGRRARRRRAPPAPRAAPVVVEEAPAEGPIIEEVE